MDAQHEALWRPVSGYRLARFSTDLFVYFSIYQ